MGRPAKPHWDAREQAYRTSAGGRTVYFRVARADQVGLNAALAAHMATIPPKPKPKPARKPAKPARKPAGRKRRARPEATEPQPARSPLLDQLDRSAELLERRLARIGAGRGSG